MIRGSFYYSELIKDQLPMVVDWLRKPHVSDWFHGEGLQNTLKGLDDFVNHRAGNATYWVGSMMGKEPFSLLITSYADPYDPQYELVPFKGKTIVTLDLLIGRLEYLGKGYGSRLIVDFLQQKFPHASDFVIDPEKENVRAIHVYKKVGFKVINEFIASWHPVPHILMHAQNNELIMNQAT